MKTRFGNSTLWRGLAVLSFCIGLAIWSTGQLIFNAWHTLPMGDSQFATVPLFNVWTIWWNAESALHGWEHYWNAPIFFPQPGAFAFSEPQPITVLLAPLLWTTQSPALTYNVYLWTSLSLNGIFAFRFLRQAEFNFWPALFGAGVIILLPLLHEQRDVIQLIPMWGFLWTWSCLLKLGRNPQLVVAMETALALLVAFLTCIHHSLFFVLLSGVTIWFVPANWFRRPDRQRTWWGPAVCAAVLFGLFAAPIALKIHAVGKENRFQRGKKTITNLSAKPIDYLVPAGNSVLGKSQIAALHRRAGFHLSIGWVRCGMAFVGILFGLISPFRRRWTVFLLANLVVAITLSHGANLHIGEWQPWWTLTEYVPGFKQVRSAFRFAYFAQLAAGLLTALSLQGLWEFGERFSNRLAAGLVLIAGTAAVFECTPEPPTISGVSRKTVNSPWIQFLRENRRHDHGVICLPMAKGQGVGDFEITARWMYFGMLHRAPLVNGYSGFFPKGFTQFRANANELNDAGSTLESFSARGIKFIVIATRRVDDPFAEQTNLAPVHVRSRHERQ